VIWGASYHKAPGGTVGEAMTAAVETVDAEEDLTRVTERFLASRYRRFPVLEGTRLVGLIARRDVLQAVMDLW
jgi:CBS domain-containing protein